MKYLVCLIVLLVILGLYLNTTEGFTVYQIDYGTGIGPWWAQGAGLNRGYNRCICSGTGDCRCINDRQFENSYFYPQYYFN